MLRGMVRKVIRNGDNFAVTLQNRGTRISETIKTDLAFDCSGFRPDLNQPLIKDLIARGLARPDPHGLGLAVEGNGQVVGQHGEITAGLFAIGPLCQGTLWEITAVPEITAQADQAAQSLARQYDSEGGAKRLAV